MFEQHKICVDSLHYMATQSTLISEAFDVLLYHNVQS